MTTTTARYKLPLIEPGQAQKEMFHNESLAAIDALLNAVVEAVGTTQPPSAPEAGQSWIAGAAPTGAWAGSVNMLASWTDGGWRFFAPVAGMRAIVRASGMPVEWDGSAWRQGEIKGARVLIAGKQVVGERQPGIAAPVGGATVDSEARVALGAILSALRAHGLIT